MCSWWRRRKPGEWVRESNRRQKLVLKITKSKNREAIAEQRIMNQINHPHILYSYGLIYPENYKRLDLKNLEKFLPKRPKKHLMSSVDKLMKKNKYGERQFPKFEKNRSPIMKHYEEFGTSKQKPKISVSPNPSRPRVRKKFNFSKTFKDFELDKELKKEDNCAGENHENSGNQSNLKKYTSQTKGAPKPVPARMRPKAKTQHKNRVRLTRSPKPPRKPTTSRHPKPPGKFRI